MQCDAIQYAFTKEIDYARKVKLAILYILNDFCQGAEHGRVMNRRPEGKRFVWRGTRRKTAQRHSRQLFLHPGGGRILAGGEGAVLRHGGIHAPIYA